MSDTIGGKNTLHKPRHIFQVPGVLRLELVYAVAFQGVYHMNKGSRINTRQSSHAIFHSNDRAMFRHGDALPPLLLISRAPPLTFRRTR